MISGGELVDRPGLTESFRRQCKKGYFDDPSGDNEAGARGCALQKTNASPDTPYIAVLAERNIFSADFYRVVEAPPIAKMWHILDGFKAKGGRVTLLSSDEDSISYSIDVTFRIPRWIRANITSVEFTHIPDEKGYSQYFTIVRNNFFSFTDNYWASDELGCFQQHHYTNEYGYFDEKNNVITAMRTFGACPNVDLPEKVLNASWQEILRWVFSEEDGLLKFVQDGNQR